MYNDLSAGERRLLHGEIAGILEELYAERTDEITVQLARHYTEAGEDEKAVDYLLRAGDKARTLYAYREAIDYYERALEFLRDQRDYERAARTLMKLGLTYHIAFDFTRSREAYDEGFALWQQAGEVQWAVALPSAPHPLKADWYDPPTLDPALAGDVDSTAIIEQLFSGLVDWTPEMDIVPDVARSWEVLEGGSKYVFHLRDDVYWSDGVAVSAKDFEYAWKRVLDPATASPTASMLADIKGARALSCGELSDPDSLGVQSLDDLTLLVELEGPTGYFLHLPAHPAAYPVPRHTIEAHGAAWTAPENIVTNGLFRLDAWYLGNSLVLSRNPVSHRPFTGNVQTVELRNFPDPQAALEAYESDGLDILNLSRLSPAERDQARRRHVNDYVSIPGLGTWYAGFDVTRAPFDDPRVRRAFVHAVDKETLAAVTRRGFVAPAMGGFVPPGMPGYSAGIGLPNDPGQARQLLAEAGYPGGNGFPIVHALTGSGGVPESEYLRACWRETLGIETEWEILDWEAFLTRLERERPSIYLTGWVADYPDPDNFLRVGSHIRPTGWQNETYDSLVRKARRETDQIARLKIYQTADKILVDEAAIIPLTYWGNHLLVKPWVRKIPTSGISYWFWKDVVIEPH